MAPNLMFFQIWCSTNLDNAMHLGLLECGINWLDISVVIQFSDVDIASKGDLEFLAEEAQETSGHFSWVPSAFSGTLAELVLKRSNPFNPGKYSFL